ncbi:MAG: hypothetical protein GC168_16775 [Candidatus Hydrogenedens sp.]|nr:hypothetical protein [Candidatus Hydrogenedens sp.]
MTRNFACETIDPLNPESVVEVTIPADLVRRVYQHNSVEYENLRCVKEVLDNPLNIYCGVRHMNYGFWCFVGRPKRYYVREGVIAEPFPEHLIYAVYLNDRFILYSFRPERASADDRNHIDRWEERFGGLKWTANPIS